MASKNAENVAKKVLENIGKGKKVNLGEIAREVGYSDNTADNPKLITETKTFKETVEPVTKGLWREINKIKLEMESRDITDEKYETLSNVLDRLVKNYQLLSGNATEIVEKRLSEDQQAKLDKLLNDK